ncbi:5164_t:CDS:2 [Diversispora eburnea]|uniref:5164_t:CDS:1 n=1 Tax=Diversispora eburnea TaxID=1213867 RepID=A0A9N8ZEN0_9GLOM|nr:5164_t:CDS:2 [Diversispora eburnea]
MSAAIEGGEQRFGFIEPCAIKYNGTINKISFIDEENFSLKVVTSKLNKKSQRNWKSNNKLLKNGSYNKSSNEDPGPTKIDDQKELITWKVNLR